MKSGQHGFEKLLFKGAVGKPAMDIELTNFFHTFWRAEKPEDLEKIVSVWIFGGFRRGAIGNDTHHLFPQGFFRCKNGQRIAIALAHFSSVDTWYIPDLFRKQALWNFEGFPIDTVQVFSDITGDLDMLFLVQSNWYDIGIIKEDIGSHQNGVGIETHVDAIVRISSRFSILIQCSFIGMSAVHQTLGSDSGEDRG